MGTPMARRLLAAGHELVVWNRTASRTDPLVAEGAKAAPSAAEAARDADIVITMLADPPAVQAVLADVTFKPGACLLEMSSIGPEAVRAVREQLPAEVGMVDAPVMGSVDWAAEGKLRILAGGDLDRVEPILAELGTVVRCGETGSGAALKVVLISAIIGSITLVGEALRLADALGVPDAVERLKATPLAGALERAFSTTADFPVALAAKDLGLAPIDLPMIEAARQTLLRLPDQNADLGTVARNPGPVL